MNIINKILDVFGGTANRALRTITGTGVGIYIAADIMGNPNQIICFTTAAGGFIILVFYVVIETLVKHYTIEDK